LTGPSAEQVDSTGRKRLRSRFVEYPRTKVDGLATIASGLVESISTPGSRRVAAGAERLQRPGDDPSALPIDQCTLKDLRLRHGLSVAELVRRTAINGCAYRAQETGGTPLSPRVLQALTEFYDLPPGQIEHAWARTRAQLFSRQRALAQKLSMGLQAEG
jgi:hypothetical protein